MAKETSLTSAPVASQRAEMELIEETRCARNAFAVNLDSSADHNPDAMIFWRGTHWL